MKSSPLLVIFLLTVLLILIFIPNVGEGYIRDDFTWLENTVTDSKVDYFRPFTKTTGFFRPLVSLTFGLQYHIHGLRPKPFGLFNLFLHSLNIVLVFLLLSCWEESKPYAIGASILFGLNGKAAGTAMGWISGRTTLLASFFLLLSLYSLLRIPKGNPLRFVLTAVFYFASLLSKETAVAGPVFVFFFVFLTSYEGNLKINLIPKIKKGLGTTAVFIVPLVFYFLLRFHSDAMIPLNAPEYYRYTFSPLLLLENLIEYIVRAVLLDIYVIFLFFILILASFVWRRNKLVLKESFDSSPAYIGLLWFLSFLLPSVFLPVRSNLYSYFPQIGLHVSALVVLLFIWWNKIKTQKVLRNIALISICLLLLGWGRYLFLKSESYGEDGRVSSRFTKQVIRVVSDVPSEAKVYVIDRHFGERRSPSVLISYGFNSLLHLYYPQKYLSGKIVSPNEAAETKDDSDAFFFIWENGDLSPQPLDF